MKPRIIDVEQRSDAWHAVRAGVPTASRAKDVVAKIKSGEAAARRDYRLQLAIERITGRAMEQDGFVSKEMQHGIDSEPAAFAAVEAETGHIIRRTGFVIRDDLGIGASLDGDVDDFDGIVELKAPKSATHVAYLRGRAVPSEYVPQLAHQFLVTGAKWAVFASYDNRLPEGLHLFMVRVTPADVGVEAYAAELRKFMAEVDDEVAALQALRAA